jgi:hypothetical protein
MSATIYRLPAAEDYAWAEHLIVTAECRLDEIHHALTAPFDGNPETQAEPVSLEHVGRAFLFCRDLRNYAEGFLERADRLEKAVVELRALQEEDDLSEAVGAETYLDYSPRVARQWQKAAEEAADALAKAEGREADDAR